MIYQFVPREPWEDGCRFEKHGVVCRDNPPDCAACGWNPEVAARRAEKIRAEREADCHAVHAGSR